MPLSDEHRRALDAEIQRVKGASYYESPDGIAGCAFVPCGEGEFCFGPRLVRGHPKEAQQEPWSFGEIPPEHRMDLLYTYVDWDRYADLTRDERQRIAYVSGVEEGKSVGAILDGHNPENDFAWELTGEEHASYMRGIAAGSGLTVEEMDDHYERLATEDYDSPHEAGTLVPEPPPIRDTTRNLVESVMLDAWPRNAAITDFGLDSQQHYEALYYPIREGEITPEQLDAALGHGQKLTELARNALSNPHKDVEFYTSWDGMYGRPRPEAAIGDTERLEKTMERLAGRAEPEPGPLEKMQQRWKARAAEPSRGKQLERD